MNAARPIRVLHLLGALDRGGIETWLMHVLRNIDRERLQMDFLVHDSTESGLYEAEAEALGANVLRCPRPAKIVAHSRAFTCILRDNGPYDVVHNHLTANVVDLWLSERMGVPVRIAHVHSNYSSPLAFPYGFLPRFWQVVREATAQNATLGLAACEASGQWFFGPIRDRAFPWKVLYCGHDLSPFHRRVDRHVVRAELGIADDALVIGHIGGFRREKNHEFLLEVAVEVARREPRTRLLLIGDGPLRGAIQEHVERRGLSHRVIFAGVRADVPRLLMGAVDVLLFPSLREAASLATIEAQAAGLPVVAADTVAHEIDVVPGLVTFLSLSDNAARWAEVVLQACTGVWVKQEAALANLENSPFAIRRSVAELQATYFDALRVARTGSPTPTTCVGKSQCY